MSENKLKAISIRDFIFEQPFNKKGQEIYGRFPPSNTKISFQMPRKAQKSKITARPKEKAYLSHGVSFLKEDLKSFRSEKVIARVPPLFFQGINNYSAFQKPENSIYDFTTKIERECPLNSVRNYKRERPKTGIPLSRRIITEEHAVTNANSQLRREEKRPNGKLDVFIKSPLIDMHDSEY
ncbi:hypothetical protein SteCoe_28745 [Stentor coeruleus]|uniref:Uncharacterized protein n=1 Tax=Stentor coeruleus TaxID=5963 RepID=A0A1R2B7I5_9CILI|nr:hypothetical protein SteCoe_28745 [Stentor coeruleus]